MLHWMRSLLYAKWASLANVPLPRQSYAKLVIVANVSLPGSMEDGRVPADIRAYLFGDGEGVCRAFQHL
jgi:hypothetical protein